MARVSKRDLSQRAHRIHEMMAVGWLSEWQVAYADRDDVVRESFTAAAGQPYDMPVPPYVDNSPAAVRRYVEAQQMAMIEVERLAGENIRRANAKRAQESASCALDKPSENM